MNVAKYILQDNVRLAEPRGLSGITNTQNDPTISAVSGIMLWGIENKEASSHANLIKENINDHEEKNSSALSKFMKKIKL